MAIAVEEDFSLLGPKELIGFVAPAAEASPAPRPDHDDEDSFSEDDSYSEDGDSEDSEDSEEEDPMYPMGRTENNGLTYVTSLSACLDFFFQVVPSSYRGMSMTADLLSKAWKEDPLLALKLVFNLRGIRGTGKSDKLGFYEAALWLYENHPDTLIANAAKVPQFGYYKDLLELLQRIVEGPLETGMRMRQKMEHKEKRKAGEYKAKLKKRADLSSPSVDEPDDESDAEPEEESGDEPDEESGDEPDEESDEEPEHARNKRPFKKRGARGYFYRKGAAARAAKKQGTLKPREERIAEDLEKGKSLKQEAREKRKSKNLTLASRVVEKFKSEPQFAKLYTATARMFADALARDLAELNEHGRKARISLAAKWCPSLDSAYDRQTLLCEGIACRYFPRSGFKAELSQHQYRFLAREKLRKEVLVPLRKALELPEVYMSAKEWNRVPYTRVASVAMKRYKELFLKHDEKRFQEYLDKVEKGEKKIAAGALLPHEIVRDAIRSGEQARVSELQWRTMVDELKKSGSLADSISICDVSGSMTGEPMEVCIALGMLTSELAEEPWKNKVITFSEEPAFHEISGSTLAERHDFVKRMPWGGGTDFQKSFDLLLGMAEEKKLPGEKMVKRLFVYSDMEFNECRANVRYDYDYATGRATETTSWETDYAQIRRKFEEAGYGAPPEIIFWNLRPTMSTPVTKDEKGVALVSGFSKNMLKLFMENGGKVDSLDPVAVMKEAVSGELYADLVVV